MLYEVITIGVTAYGDSLNDNEAIQYTATCAELPNFSQRLSGKAFERLNIPLFRNNFV